MCVATLKEYFDTDFPHFYSFHKTYSLASTTLDAETDVIGRVHFNFDSNAKFLSYFIPSCPNLVELCVALLENLDWVLSLTNELYIERRFFSEEPMKNSELQFSRRIFIYSEDQ